MAVMENRYNERIVTFFDVDHYIKVRKARKEQGIDDSAYPHTYRLEEHPLLGRQYYDKTSGKTLTVDGVTRSWEIGYFLLVSLVDENYSHKVVPFSNINSIDKIILRQIEETHEELERVK